MALEEFSIGQLLDFLNQGLIDMIIKNVARDSIGGWWHINLLTLFYKIMANALAL